MDESIPALKSTQAAPSDIIREKRYGCEVMDVIKKYGDILRRKADRKPERR